LNNNQIENDILSQYIFNSCVGNGSGEELLVVDVGEEK